MTITVAIFSLEACSLVPHKSIDESAESALQITLTDSDYQHAVAALKAGKEEEALTLFNAAAKTHPDLAAPYINIGLIEINRDNPHAAETALLHAATLAPEQPEIYNGLGISYRRLGRFSEAETAYLKALRFAPDYANAHLNLGILYEIYLNNLNDALHHYERYQALNGEKNEQVKKWIVDINQRLTRDKGATK